MKAKVKSGHELLSPPLEHIEVFGTDMYINLATKSATFVSFRQSKGRVTILTTEGLIELSFCSQEPQLSFSHQVKDQIVLNAHSTTWQQALINI